MIADSDMLLEQGKTRVAGVIVGGKLLKISSIENTYMAFTHIVEQQMIQVMILKFIIYIHSQCMMTQILRTKSMLTL